MALPYGERRRKLRIVADFMGCDGPGELLARYRNQAVVPGICTDPGCDWIMSVGCDEVADTCPHCETDTLQSILVCAGGH